MFNTVGADVSIILLNDFIIPNKSEITSAFFAPFENQNLTKTINYKTGNGIYGVKMRNFYDFDRLKNYDPEYFCCIEIRMSNFTGITG